MNDFFHLESPLFLYSFRGFAKAANRLRSEQALVKGEQRLVDLENVIVPLHDEVLDDDVKLAAGTQGVARAGNEVAGLRQAQLQRDSKGNGCCLGWLVVRIVADLREQLAVDIGLFVNLGVLFAATPSLRATSPQGEAFKAPP